MRIQAYQHLNNVEGDKVWYQPMNANSWLGPAVVLCHRCQSVWILGNREIKKVASCKVKPYELLDREKNKEREVMEKIMLEEGLKNVDDGKDWETEFIEANIKEANIDSVGAHYLKVVNHVSFDDAIIYTVDGDSSIQACNTRSQGSKIGHSM